MKNVLRRALSMTLSLALLSSLALTAAASEALGEDLKSQDTLLHEETQLSTNVFWSTAYSDLRTENLITYSPNGEVTPIVTYGGVLTDRSTVPATAKALEEQGYRVVAGINGDFYNVSTGLPIGIVVTQGQLRSSDGGYYAMGFRADGTAVIGKPALKVTADLGYEALDEEGYAVEVLRQLSGVNKARVSTGGIYLYTYDFNAKHTTGNTEPGVDVLCTIEDGRLSIGEEVTLTVDQVIEADSATDIGPDQMVLSVNLQSTSYHIDALRSLPVGSTVTLSVSAASEEWNDVEYAVGALYSLVENGSVVSGLPSGANPRTAVGQKADGTLVFYTIDGRKSGYSIGATLTQVAQRLIELGCVNALCLDGGGSTTLTVTSPDSTSAKTYNIPSDGSTRAVSNQIFLVAGNEPSGRLSHFYVQADNQYVLAGSKVNISASAVDTNYIPMEEDFDLEADDGDLDGNVLTTPDYGCEITVTADHRGKSGSTTVHVIETPDAVAIRDGSGSVISTLSVAPGSSATLTATAAYQHLSLKADPEAFRWTVTGGIGTVSDAGVFTATAPGTGTITVSAGGQSASVEVAVSNMALQTVEDFEDEDLMFSGGPFLAVSRTSASDYVRIGRAAGKLDYDLQDYMQYYSQASAFSHDISSLYTSLNMWIYGDGSGNQLSFLYLGDTKGYLELPITTLDFTGWKQVSVSLPQYFTLQGIAIYAPSTTYTDEFGDVATDYADTPRTGTIYIDHITASYNNIVDNEAPAVTAALDNDNWQVTATVADAVDGVLPKSSVSVTYNGTPMDFTYSASGGKVTFALPGPGESYDAMRVTITARDASGNIGRASVDVDSYGVDHRFTDIDGYWAATYVDFLYNAGVTTGYEDGTFRPNQNITRAQFAVMLYRYLGLDESKYADVTLPFADNGSIPSYAVPAIRALYTEGIINGSAGKDGRLYFNPGSSLTRAQAATMIGRTQEKGYATVSLTFTDSASIPGYATYYIQTMAAQGIIGGYTDGTFRPNSNITRGQMAKILYNLM